MSTTPGMNGDYVKALRAIKAKTLIMTGTKDLLNPEWEPLEAARYIRDVRTVPINPDSVTGHFAAGGFIPADVEQINMEVERLLDIATQRGPSSDSPGPQRPSRWRRAGRSEPAGPVRQRAVRIRTRAGR